MKYVFAIFIFVCVSNSFAAALHFGEYSVEATPVKHTTPSLNIINEFGERFYVAAYDTMPAPKNVFHVKTVDKEYHLGPWCDAGYYASRETNKCVPCGYGHFCTGGNHRESCTYGIIACNTKTASYDPPMPAGTENMYNRALTMAEVNQYVPITDITDWGKIFYNFIPQQKSCTSGENYPDNPDLQRFDHTVGPGTYIIVHEYPVSNQTGSVSNRSDHIETAYIAIFDHTVVYRPVHVCNFFANYFDISHIPYEKYDLVYPHSFGESNDNITNVENLNTIFTSTGALGLYELK